MALRSEHQTRLCQCMGFIVSVWDSLSVYGIHCQCMDSRATRKLQDHFVNYVINDTLPVCCCCFYLLLAFSVSAKHYKGRC